VILGSGFSSFAFDLLAQHRTLFLQAVPIRPLLRPMMGATMNMRSISPSEVKGDSGDDDRVQGLRADQHRFHEG
jgi:hypothetical protein